MFALRRFQRSFAIVAAVALALTSNAPVPTLAQNAATPPAATNATPPPTANAPADGQDQAPAPLTDDELYALVARIALYPDDLIALISAAALYPLQIVEAQRYLDNLKKNPDAEPSASWDGSIISLLNYPEIVAMMNEDLQWTQSFGTAIAYQQKDVLLAIQQLRDKAVDEGAIKTDDKVTVTEEGDDVIIQPTNPEAVYIPVYAPEMLYADYPIEPITYYPQSYPLYYNPAATYFAGAVTGAFWAATVDWDKGDVWAGRWNGDIDISCSTCLNNINGKVKLSDVDWNNVDRSQLSIDRSELTGANVSNMRNDLASEPGNNLREKAEGINWQGAAALGTVGAAAAATRAKDVRVSHQGGGQAADAARAKAAGATPKAGGAAATKAAAAAKPKAAAAAKAGGSAKSTAAAKSKTTAAKSKTATTKQKAAAAKPKAAARPDTRTATPSALGEVRGGAQTRSYSKQGQTAMRASSSRPPSAMPVQRGGGGGRGGGGRR